MQRLAAIVALSFLAAPAFAESWTVECASNSPGPWPDSMFCNEAKMLAFTPGAPEANITLKISVPGTHCSDISYLINRLPGSSEPIAILERMHPGETRKVKLGTGWNEGENYVTVTAVGHVGGCNTGVLASWGAITIFIPEQ